MTTNNELMRLGDQVQDINGDPISGAKLYFYAKDTTTPVDTYSDNAGNTPNSNPVICDSAGRPASGSNLIGIFGKSTQEYKLVVKDSDDVTIYTNNDLRTPSFGVQPTSTSDGIVARVRSQITSSVTVTSSTFVSAGLSINHAANAAGNKLQFTIAPGKFWKFLEAALGAQTVYEGSFVAKVVNITDTEDITDEIEIVGAKGAPGANGNSTFDGAATSAAPIVFEVEASDTEAKTYQLQVRNVGGTSVQINCSADSPAYMQIEEYGPNGNAVIGSGTSVVPSGASYAASLYTEGTWVPSISTVSGTGTATLSVNYARYQYQPGNYVRLEFDAEIASSNLSSGARCNLAGFPVAVIPPATGHGLVQELYFESATQGDELHIDLSSAGTVGILRRRSQTGAWQTDNIGALLTNGTKIGGVIEYVGDVPEATGGNVNDDATIDAFRGDKRINIAEFLTRTYRLDAYTGFTGDGVASDQVAWNSMMADILANNGGYAVIEGDPSWTVNLTANQVDSGLRNIIVEGNGMTIKNGNSLDGVIQWDDSTDIRFHNVNIDGLYRNKITSCVALGGTITVVTQNAHGFITGQHAGIRGVVSPAAGFLQKIWDSQLENVFQITVVDSTTFTFTAPSGIVDSTFDTTYAECNMATRQFGQDGIRMRRCRNVLIDGCAFLNVRDAAIRGATLTDSSTIASNPTLPVYSDNFTVVNSRFVNCNQVSMTPGGGSRVKYDNNDFFMSFGGSPKFASRMRDATQVLFTGNTVRKSFDDATIPIGGEAGGLVLEGIKNFIVQGNSFEEISGLGIFIAVNDGDATRLTRKDLAEGIVSDNVIRNNQYLPTKEAHAIRVDTGQYTDSVDPVKNIQINDNIIDYISGHGIYTGNGLGYSQNIHINDNIITRTTLNAINHRPNEAQECIVKGNSCSRAGHNGTNWASGQTYATEITLLNAGNAYRVSTAGGGVTANAPTHTGGEQTYGDGYRYKWLCSLENVCIGNSETGNAVTMQDCLVADNILHDNPDGDGIKSYKTASLVLQSNHIHNNAGNAIDILDCTSPHILNNVCEDNTSSCINLTGSTDMVIKGNVLDVGATSNISAIIGSNTEGLVSGDNVFRNVAGSGFCYNFGSTSNMKRVRIAGTDQFVNIPDDRRYNLGYEGYEDNHLDDSEIHIGVTLLQTSNPYNRYSGPISQNSTIRNLTSTVGEYAMLTCTTSGFSEGTDFSSILSSNIASPSYGNQFYKDSSSKVWNLVGDNGAGTPTMSASEIAANIYGILDGTDANCHWRRITTSDFAYPLWTASTSYNRYDRAFMGFNVTSLTQSGGTATCVTASAHGLTTGDEITINRASPSGYNVKDAVVTVVNATTFTYAVSSGLSSPATVNSNFTDIVAGFGSFEMVKPTTATSGSTLPKGPGVANGDYYFEYWGPAAVLSYTDNTGVLVAA